MMAIDGYAYRTCKYWGVRFRRRLARPGRWRPQVRAAGSLGGRFVPGREVSSGDGRGSGVVGEATAVEMFRREVPAKEEAERTRQILADRGVEILQVFTGEVREAASDGRRS